MNVRFTCSPAPVHPSLVLGVTALSLLLFGATPNTLFAASSGEATLPPASITASVGTTTCIGSDITFELGSFDFDPADITEVPWVVSHNGAELTDTNLDQFLLLGALGSSLSDWTSSTTLTFSPLVEGCFTVGVDPYIFYGTAASQNVESITVVVADKPSTPSLSGFGAAPGETPVGVLLCDGGSTNGALASNTVGEVAMSMSYSFEDEAGIELASAEILDQMGEACDGPSINMTFASGPLNVGRYVFTATATNVCGASSTSLDVEVVRLPEFELSSAPICVATNAEVFSDFDVTGYAMSEGGLPMASALWSDGGTELASNTFIAPEGGDEFTQEITLMYELFGEQATCIGSADATQVVHIPSSIDLVVNGGITDNLVCEGESLELSLDNVSAADPVESFVWASDVPPNASTPESLFWESFELDVAGTITQTSVWADGTSCDNTLDFDVDVSPMPEIAWTVNNATICAGNDAGLILENTSSESVNVDWELSTGATGSEEGIPAGNSPTEGVLILGGDNFPDAGQFVVTVTPTDALGCIGTSIEGLVEVESNPDASATFAESCEGSTVVPTGVVTGAQYSYEWSTAGSATVGQGASTAAPEIDNVACGDAVSLRVTETFFIDGAPLQCHSEEQIILLDVVALPQPELTTDSPLCNGVDVVLELTDASDLTLCTNVGTTYTWTLDDGTTVSNNAGLGSFTLDNVAFETLNVTIEAEATGSISGAICPVTTDFVFDLNDNPELPVLPTDWSICENGSLIVQADAISNPNGGILAYSWNNSNVPAAFVIAPFSPTTSKATLTVAAGGSASEGEVTLTVLDAQGCIAEASTTIDILDVPVADDVTWSDDILCSGDGLTLNFTDIVTDPTITAPAAYAWNVTGSNGVSYNVSNVANFEDEVTNLILPEVPFAADLDPVTIDLVLDLDDGTCQNQQSWEEVVDVYPNPKVSLITGPNNDNDVCSGTDWEGALEGASDIAWTGPTTGTSFSSSLVDGSIAVTVPWDEIMMDTDGSAPFAVPLTVTSAFSDIQCVSTWDLTLDVLENPEVDIVTVDAICVESTESLTADLATGTGQGGPMMYAWTNVDDPPAFDFSSESGAVIDIEVSTAGSIPDEGSVQLTATDQEGCVGLSPVTTLTIIELPVLGNLTVTPDAACSGTDFDIALSDIAVDDGLNVADVQYAWTGTVENGNVAITGTGLNVTATPSIAEVPFQDFVAPEALELNLTASIAGCESSVTWTDLAAIYPAPLAEEDNEYVCIGQNWDATITGCEVLTVLGQNGLPNITWTTADAATGIDISLSPDYFEATASQFQNTFVFSREATYVDAGLTCFTEEPFEMRRRNAPNFSVVGDDNSGPAGDFIMCEGSDLILEADVTFSGNDPIYEWTQLVDDGTGNATFQTLASSDADAFFIDVEADAPLDAPTLYEGFTTVTYTYPSPTPADFECVVEAPWSFQVLPTPVLSVSTSETHVCDGDSVMLTATLEEGATTLNGAGVTWDWDWSGSTINEVNNTSSPSNMVPVEAQYVSTLDGTFDQNFSVTVTDNYGCLSSPPTVITITALERAVVGLERPFVCSDDTLEVLANGADVYTWSVDPATADGILEDPVFFPNYVPTGDSIQTLVLYSPSNGENIQVTGALVYVLSETETLMCEAEANVNLAVFDVPVLDMSILGDPAPYCDGDVLTFEDLNTDAAAFMTYDYWTSAGLDITGDANNTVTFALQSEETIFEVSKYRTYFAQGNTIVCSASDTATFEVIANPVISLDGDAGICQDGLGSVVCEVSDVDSTFTYTPTWTASANADTSEVNFGLAEFGLEVASLNGISIASEPDLIFSVYVKDNNGCISETESYNMQVVATPVLSISDALSDALCSPSQDCMQVDLMNEDLTGVDVLYFWDNEPGSTNDGICVNFVNPTQCPFADSINVTVRYEHTLLDGQTVFCENSAVDSTVVNPTPLPDFALAAPQACLDLDSLNCVPILHDTAAYDVCQGDSLSYEWFVTPLGDLIQNNLVTADLTSPFPSICVDTAGVVNVVLEITNSYGCAQTTSNVPFTVQGLPVPELTFEQNSICLPTTVSVLNSSAGAANFSMSIPGYPVYENFLSPLELEVEFPGYYNAEFTVSNTHIIDGHELTCSVDTEYVNAFEGRTPPVAEFAVLPDTLIEFVNPVVEFVNLSEGQVENIWSFGNGEGSSELDPEVEYEAAGFYNAQLQVVNEYGCTDVYSQEIEVYTDLYIYVPTAFTPDNDGLNDAWLPSIIGQDVIATYECSVFARSGDRVFYTTNPNKAWIGGNDLSGEGMHYPSGGEVFAWRISIKKKGGQGAKTYTGHVTMIR